VSDHEPQVTPPVTANPMIEDEHDQRMAPPGTAWVCAACGRHISGDRYELGDTSCVTWAQLCSIDSFVYDANGRLIGATATRKAR
jgi:hypothetical protein